MAARTLTSASLLLILTASYLAAQSPAPAQPRPPQTYPAFLQAQYASIKRYIIGSAEKMPAEHFALTRPLAASFSSAAVEQEQRVRFDGLRGVAAPQLALRRFDGGADPLRRVLG